MFKGLSHGSLNCLDQGQNGLQIEGNLKIVVNEDRKTPKR